MSRILEKVAHRGWLPVSLRAAGILEIALFGLPLIFLGSHIQPYVWRWDPHIYKEYGVARVAVGGLFLAASASPAEDVRLIGRFAAAFYALHLAVALFDLATGNVARVEWAVVGLNALWVLVFGRLSF